MKSPSPLLPCLLPLLLGALPAQVDRYELGLRLRAFERRLGAAADGPERHAALGELNRAVQAFFSLDTAAVARAIAAADRALDGGALDGGADDPLRTVADSVQLVLDRRLVDAGQPTLPLRLGAAYPIETSWPADLHLEVRLPGDRSKSVQSHVARADDLGRTHLRHALVGRERLLAAYAVGVGPLERPRRRARPALYQLQLARPVRASESCGLDHE